MIKNILNLGDAALYCDFGSDVNQEINSNVIKYFYHIKKLNLKSEIILEKFFSKNYFCYMTGFVAGMPFLGDLEKDMRLKRLETPRVKVPKGSVGITEQFCNIYTFETPGGWNILGNTPQNIFDTSNQSNPNLVNPGDTIKFYRITLDQYNEIKR